MDQPRAALDAARRAIQFWREYAEEGYALERNLVRAEWVLGWALIALAADETDRQDEHLAEAEGHLTDAPTRCRRINLVELEPVPRLPSRCRRRRPARR